MIHQHPRERKVSRRQLSRLDGVELPRRVLSVPRQIHLGRARLRPAKVLHQRVHLQALGGGTARRGSVRPQATVRTPRHRGHPRGSDGWSGRYDYTAGWLTLTCFVRSTKRGRRCTAGPSGGRNHASSRWCGGSVVTRHTVSRLDMSDTHPRYEGGGTPPPPSVPPPARWRSGASPAN